MTDLSSYGTFLNEKAQQTLTARTHRRQRHRRSHRHLGTTSLDPSRWMSQLPDTSPLSSLTIPGTHDSAAYQIMWPFISTQTLSITEQLDSGIRYFDFRCGMVNNTLQMVHGPALLKRTLPTLLDQVYTWLSLHPSEALIIQIKPDRAPEDSTLSFTDAVLSLLLASRDRWRFTPSTPTLGELRGRIQLFRRFPGPGWAGIPVWKWPDNAAVPFTIHTFTGLEITIQDHYNPTSPQPLGEFVAAKERDVVGLLERAEMDADEKRWYVNFGSAYEFNLYWQASPKDVAVGGWWYYVFTEGINPRLHDWLAARKGGRRRLGVVVLDYPEQPVKELVRELLMTNFEGQEKKKISTAAIWALMVLLVMIFLGGVLLVAIHGPVSRGYCPPFLHACYTGRWETS